MRPEATPELDSGQGTVAGAASKVLAVGDTDGSASRNRPFAPARGRPVAAAVRARPTCAWRQAAVLQGAPRRLAPASRRPGQQALAPRVPAAPAPRVQLPHRDRHPLQTRISAGQDGGATVLRQRCGCHAARAALPRSGRRLLPEPPSATYDVVVDPSGAVEQIRLIAGDAGMRESMMRAHIKSWKFRPATRDGQPVRYRMQVRVAV